MGFLVYKKGENMSNYEIKYPIVKHYAGSISYGTSLPTSDTDIRGIFCAEQKHVRTPFFPVREVDIPDEEDGKLYELANFLGLYLKGNPNILETLWVDGEDIIEESLTYDYLRSQREELLSSKITFTFSGYAVSQLKRIKGHNKWINNPQPKQQPLHKDYLKLIQNFSDEKIMPRDFTLYHLNNFNIVHYGANIFGAVKEEGVNAVTEKGDFNISAKQVQNNTTEEPPVFIFKYLVDEYKTDKERHHNYWTWKNNRNEARSELESKYGYDCYSDDTEFLTEDGWKLFDEVGESKLATFDQDHKVVFQSYTEKMDNLYTGNMYHFTGQHQDTLVTAGHRMYVKDYSRNIKKDISDWKFEEACQVKKDHKVLKVIKPKTNLQKFPNETYIGSLKLRNYLRLLGWFVSDGSLSFNTKGEPKSLSISQSKKGSSLTQTITRLRNVGELKCKHYAYKREGKDLTENTWVFDKELAKSVYQDCGHGSHFKRLPKWVFYLTKSMMNQVLKCALQGDGTKRQQDKTYIYYSANKDLADDIQRLSFMCGYESSLWGPYVYERKEEKFKNLENCPMYQVHINMAPSEEDINSSNNVITMEVDSKRVVCFSVPNGTLVTRRNGKISLHGNCKHAMHLVRLLRMAEEALTGHGIIVKRPDAKELLDIRAGAWEYDDLVKWAEDKDRYIQKVLYPKTHLRKKPNINLAAEILMECQDICWGNI